MLARHSSSWAQAPNETETVDGVDLGRAGYPRRGFARSALWCFVCCFFQYGLHNATSGVVDTSLNCSASGHSCVHGIFLWLTRPATYDQDSTWHRLRAWCELRFICACLSASATCGGDAGTARSTKMSRANHTNLAITARRMQPRHPRRRYGRAA
jgi:hypothetical protein